jgi:hypothetical protein
MASTDGSARERHAAHNVVAVYPTLEAARRAAAALSEAGVDAVHIELMDRQAHERDDRAVPGRVGRRAAIGAGIGAVVGVLIGLLIHLLADAPVVPEIVGALIGLIVGVGLGAFYGGATALPREGTFSTIRSSRNGVAVHADTADLVDQAVATLRPTNPELLARFGTNGELHPL